jgi:NAD(P)H-quinone oxidoreductase subunit 6
MSAALTALDPATIFFWLLSASLLLSAAGVAFLPHIVYSAFALLGALASVAGLYLWLGADLLGVAQLLVYVGGVLVLLLFAVLLTSRIADVRVSNLSAAVQVGVPVAVALVALVCKTIWLAPWPAAAEGAARHAPTTARLGDALLREHLLPFELVSFVLLVVLAGTMAVARRAIATAPEGGA